MKQDKSDLADFLKEKMKSAKKHIEGAVVTVEDEDSSEDESDEQIMAEEVIQAVKDGDSKALIESLRALINALKD